MSRSLLFATLPALALIPASAHAQGNDIVVTATGFDQNRNEVGQSISVIDRDRLDTLQSISLSDALATIPGLAVVRTGGTGAQTSVFIRGANSSQTLVLVDGVRINDPSTPNGAFDFGAMMADNVARVEVLRGPNSVIWGSQAIGGVVNIIHAEPTERLSARVGAEYGAHDSAKVTGNVAGKAGIVSASIGGSFTRTDGISARTINTERDGYKNASANARVKIAVSDAVSIDLRGYYTRAKLMIDDGFSTSPLSDPRTDTEQFVAYAGVNAALLDGRWQNRIAYTRTDIDRVGTDPEPGSYNVLRARGEIDRFEYRGAFDVTDGARLIFGVEQEQMAVSTHQPAAFPVDASLNSNTTSIYGQALVAPLTGLNLSAGVRHDDTSRYGSATTFGANAAYSPNAGVTVLRATFAQGFRVPTMVDALLPNGNPALKPEESESYDLGIEQRFLNGAVVASATWFDRRSRNLIVLDSSYVPQNIGRARAQGVELTLDLRPVETLRVAAGYTYVDAQERTTGGATFVNRQLARRPKHSISASVDWTSPIGLKLGADVRAVSDRYDSDFGNSRADGYEIAGLRASYPVTDRAEIYGRIENLFDADYRTVNGYNTLGRSAYAGIRVKY